jgi:hypothetical protein
MDSGLLASLGPGMTKGGQQRNSTMKDIGNIGMIGLGKMGMPMARLANAARAGSRFLEI